MRILIAEDDQTSRKFLAQVLAQYGECDLTVDGLEALDAFLLSLQEKRPYGVVCLDIMMPKVDGVKALQTIRQLEQGQGGDVKATAKVIMISALEEPHFVQTAFDLGCNVYLAKPLTVNELEDAMEKIGIKKL